MGGDRPGYKPKGEVPAIYDVSLPGGWELVANPYYDPFSRVISHRLPFLFRKLVSGHLQFGYPVCPDFEKVIIGLTVPAAAIISFDSNCADNVSDGLPDSDSSGGNISDDDSRSSMEPMPLWGADDESNDGSSACGGSAGSVSHAFRCPCGLSHLHYF